MTTPMMILKSETVNEYGVLVKKLSEGDVIFCNFKTYGGTEKEVNGILAVEDTAVVTTWYRPDINSSCVLRRMSDGAEFEILGEPENIEMRNMVLKMKIRRVKGGA